MTTRILKEHRAAASIKVAALVLMMWSAAGCGKSVEKLAQGKGALAADAKAVLAALAKLKKKPKKVPAYKTRAEAFEHCRGTDPHAAVVIEGDRIVELFLSMVDGGIDLAPLKKVAKLRHLDLRACGLHSLPRVDGLSVETIDARFNSIKAVDGVRNLPKLKLLDLSENPLKTLEGLEDLPALATLNFDPKALTRVRNINNVGVKKLDFKGGVLQSLELSTMPALSMVIVPKNKLLNLVIKDAPKLELINARENDLASVTLSGVSALTHLGLAKNRLTAVPKVGGRTPRLAWFDLAHNKLTSLAGLEALDPKEFFVNNNKLTSLTLVAGSAEAGQAKPGKGTPAPSPTVPKLVTLRADRNQITSLDGIAAFPALTYLYIGNNKLTSLAGIEQAKKLKKVHVDYNQLTTLVPLATAQLVELIANNNKLADRRELFGPQGTTRPKIARYDVRRNAWVGVAASLLFFGMATPSYYGLYKPPKTTGGSGHYRGGRGYRSSRRYSGGGGYRSGK